MSRVTTFADLSHSGCSLVCAARSKWYHKAEMEVGLETDPSEMLNEIIRTTRPAGIVSDVGCAHDHTPVHNAPVCTVKPS